MWRCETCGQLVDEDDFELCWNCSAPRTDLPREVEERPTVSWKAGTADRPLAVLQAIRLGFRIVVQHPMALLAAVPLLVWRLAGSSGRLGGASLWLVWGPDAVFGVLTAGFVYAFVATAVRDRPSIARASIDAVRWSPMLMATAAVRMAVMLGVFLWPRPLFMSLVMLVFGYLSVRLAFWPVAIIVDGNGLIRAARDAWELARGNWWRLFGLTILIVGAERAIGRWLPLPYMSIIAKWLIGIVGEAATATLYLQRVGVLPRRPTLGDVVAERAARRQGIGDLAAQ